MPLVMDVKSASVSVLKNTSKPNELIAVSASGQVPTTGWTNPMLVGVIHIVPPADGIWDFEFVATKPTGIVGQVVLPIHASTVERMPPWFKGVRVHARTNSVVAMLGVPLEHLVA